MAFRYNDNPVYYRVAREAVQIERGGDYRRAAKVWTKAGKEARNAGNQEWCERRSDFCLMQIGREKLKELSE